MSEEDPDLLAGDNLDKLRGREPYSAMSERFRLTEELENARYQNNLLTQKCRELEAEVEKLRPIANEQYRSYELAARVLKERDEARQERDEARREVMSSISDQACRFEDVVKEYKKRGWEYLKENANGEQK